MRRLGLLALLLIAAIGAGAGSGSKTIYVDRGSVEVVRTEMAGVMTPSP